MKHTIKFRKAILKAAWEYKTSTPGGIRDTYGCTNYGFTTGRTTDFCGGCSAYMGGELK